jgi:hypothetical protein
MYVEMHAPRETDQLYAEECPNLQSSAAYGIKIGLVYPIFTHHDIKLQLGSKPAQNTAF